MSTLTIDQFFSETENLAAAGNLDEATEQFNQLLDNQDAIKARAYNNLGVIAFQGEDREKALECYRKAVELAPEMEVYRKNLADLCYFAFGDAETALTHYRQIMVDNPTDFDANLAIGRICADLGKHFLNEANDFLELAEKIRPNNEFVTCERERLEQSCKVSPKPADETINANNSGSGDPVADYTKLSEKFATQEALETEGQLLSFLQQYPDFALAHNDLGVISHQQEKLEQAGRRYREAVRLEPDNMTFRKNLADFLFIIESDPEAAMEHYHAVLKNDPKDIETLMMIGNICLALESEEEARNFFNMVLEVEPWNGDANKVLKMLDEQADTNPQ